MKSMNSDYQKTNDSNEISSRPATFEEAITETGFGKYNYFLLFTITFPCMTQLINTVDLSFILPVAQCDLNLSLEDKGILNAMTFAGMITSGFLWGYLCDALGRKQIIIYGYFASGICGLIGAFSMNKTILMAAKFMTGLILNGPFGASTAHITEFHSNKYRGRVNLARGIFFSMGNLLLPILSWAILPRKWNINIFNIFVLHSWNIFLLGSAIITLLSGVLYLWIPESPKFLMSAGRNDDALKVMQNVFSKNTGRPKEEYPIKSLTEEVKMNPTKKMNIAKALKHEMKVMVTIFHKPHIQNLALACFNAFSLVMSLNTLKLWLPGIFQSISDYHNSHNGETSSICEMLKQMRPHNVSSLETCSVDTNNLSVYANTFIVAFTRLLAFAISGTFIRMLGVKTSNIICCYISATLMLSIYFASDSTTVTTLAAIGTAIGSVAENLLIVLTLELFPTSLRAFALSIHLTLGRTGTLLGNIVFPYLLYLGCLPPFLYIGIFGISCGTMSLLYSSVENRALE